MWEAPRPTKFFRGVLLAFALDHAFSFSLLLAANTVVIASAYAAMGMLQATAFGLARIAEHQRGPVLAFGGLAGAIGAFLKLVA